MRGENGVLLKQLKYRSPQIYLGDLINVPLQIASPSTSMSSHLPKGRWEDMLVGIRAK